MPLPFILGGIALAVIGGIAFLTIREFFNKLRELKAELERERRKRIAARVVSILQKGDYSEVDVGLTADGQGIGTVSYKVDKDEARRELREGMTL
ncbi:hypothetical protein [Helicobacter suis]|uniref:hypothetical protein n=1 Tax=Helicobacter suis TaxID=104628 RepID=UPI0013D5628A|nr:hypothetical protein [Helicobacter suis]